MLSGINTTALSQMYNSQVQDYGQLSLQIASGKKINKPSDDFVGYTRANNIGKDIKSYQTINTNLTELREPAQMASDLGNANLEDLTRMKELSELYATETDTEAKSTYNAEFKALGAGIHDRITKNKYGTVLVVDDAAAVASAKINPDSADTLDIQFAATDIIGGTNALNTLGLDAADTNTVTTTEVDAEIVLATSYAVKADGYLSQIDRQVEMNENLISAKEDTVDSIMNIDEMKSLNEATGLQIRQQASVSMFAQANLTSSFVSRLYS